MVDPKMIIIIQEEQTELPILLQQVTEMSVRLLRQDLVTEQVLITPDQAIIVELQIEVHMEAPTGQQHQVTIITEVPKVQEMQILPITEEIQIII